MSRLIVMAVAIFFSICANAGDMLGIMKCKATENKLIILDDGKPSIYTGYKDGISTGDTLYVNYKLFTFFGMESIRILLFEEGTDSNNIFLDHGFPVDHKSENPDEAWLVSIKDHNGVFQVNKDTLLSRSADDTLILHRYYKNDWEGMYVQTSSTSIRSQIITLDCRQITNVYEEYVSYIASSVGYNDEGVTLIPRDEFDKAMEKKKLEEDAAAAK